MARTYRRLRKYKSYYELIPSKFKKLKRKQRRLKEKIALKIGKIIPIFKKSDRWNWL